MTNQLTHRRDFCPGTAVFIQNLFVHFAIFHVSKRLAISGQGLFSFTNIQNRFIYIYSPRMWEENRTKDISDQCLFFPFL